MIDPDDLTPPPTALRGSSSGKWWLAAILVLVAGGIAAGAFLYSRARSATAEGLEAVGPLVTPPEPEPVAEPILPPVDAPPVDQSDAWLRERVRAVSSDADARKWMETPGLVRRIAAAVAGMADGDSPRAALSFLAPNAPPSVVTREGVSHFTPQSFARYDAIARAAQSVDVEAAATAYRAIEPLCGLAWKEIAPGGSAFRDSVKASLSWIADSNLPEASQLALTPKGAVWAFADPQLESRSALEKHLLRMGPENAAKVKGKAQALRAALFPAAADAGAPAQ